MTYKYDAKIVFSSKAQVVFQVKSMTLALSCALLAGIPHHLNSSSDKVSKCIGNILKCYFATPFGRFRWASQETLQNKGVTTT
jgi:hypothetical protein